MTKKGNEAPSTAGIETQDGISVLIGETRESKAKAYAAEESIKVSSRYISLIDNMKAEHDT